MSLVGLPRRKDADGVWETFVVGPQVLKLRAVVSQPPDRRLRALVSPLADGYVLPSVSVRDDKRDLIDLWTSRNRVATTGDRSGLRHILQELELGLSLSEAIKPYRNTLGPQLEDQMRRVLFLEN